MEALFLFLRYEFNDIVRCAADDIAQFLDGKKGNVLSFFQSVKNSVADSGMQQMILADLLFFYCFP